MKKLIIGIGVFLLCGCAVSFAPVENAKMTVQITAKDVMNMYKLLQQRGGTLRYETDKNIFMIK
jgi:hypothetical protein